MWMLEQLGQARLPRMLVAPVVVRGTTHCCIDDLMPVRVAASHYGPALGRGMVVSIGLPLADFGRVVMEKAREAA
jgi:hypothetical protein